MRCFPVSLYMCVISFFVCIVLFLVLIYILELHSIIDILMCGLIVGDGMNVGFLVCVGVM